MKINSNYFKPRTKNATPVGQAGYDNVRENIDPHIKTKVVSTQEYNGSGKFRLVGNGTVWDDLRFPANGFRISDGTNPPAATAYKGGYVLAFADEAVNEEVIYFIIQMPHNWKEGSTIYPHIHWVGEDNTAGNVYWQFTYSWANIGEAFPMASTIYKVAANGDTDVHSLASFDGITGAGYTLSSCLICSLKRKSSSASDTFTGKDAYLIEFDLHYEIDSLGSDEEYIKY